MQEINPFPPPEEQLLGEIETEITGIQHHDAVVHPGEQVSLERKPENTDDKNAIRVENLSFQPAGYLPQNVASWLAPLLDAGKIRVDGYMPQAGRLAVQHIERRRLSANGTGIIHCCSKNKNLL
jgi:hypothetical protein